MRKTILPIILTMMPTIAMAQMQCIPCPAGTFAEAGATKCTDLGAYKTIDGNALYDLKDGASRTDVTLQPGVYLAIVQGGALPPTFAKQYVAGVGFIDLGDPSSVVEGGQIKYRFIIGSPTPVQLYSGTNGNPSSSSVLLLSDKMLIAGGAGGRAGTLNSSASSCTQGADATISVPGIPAYGGKGASYTVETAQGQCYSNDGGDYCDTYRVCGQSTPPEAGSRSEMSNTIIGDDCAISYTKQTGISGWNATTGPASYRSACIKIYKLKT
jgi:hypothetical protein